MLHPASLNQGRGRVRSSLEGQDHGTSVITGHYSGLCGDYKVTVNRVSSLEQYPIPKMEDMFTSLAGGEKICKLDMSHAYQQIRLDED